MIIIKDVSLTKSRIFTRISRIVSSRSTINLKLLLHLPLVSSTHSPTKSPPFPVPLSLSQYIHNLCVKPVKTSTKQEMGKTGGVGKNPCTSDLKDMTTTLLVDWKPDLSNTTETRRVKETSCVDDVLNSRGLSLPRFLTPTS